jgi:hypothetical protein
MAEKRKILRGKEAKLVKALAKTSNVSEAGRMAGYTKAQAAHHALRNIQKKVPEIMDRIGLTDEYLLKECLKPGLTALETKFFADKGVVLDQKEVIAWGARRDFLDMACKLKGLYMTREGDGANGESERNRPGGNSLSLVFTNEGAAREFVEAIASRRSSGGFAGVDAEVDPNLGRA